MPDRAVTIAVISDTHADRFEELPPEMFAVLDKVDAVIHLGDFSSYAVLKGLKKFRNFFAVRGNHDRQPLLRKKLRVMEVLELGGKRIGIFHGFFFPFGTLQRMKKWFSESNIDILLYGHTHLITQKMIDGVYFFNPGSVAGSFPSAGPSFGLLTLDGTITSEIVYLEKSRSISWEVFMLIPMHLVKNVIRFLEVWPWINFSRLKIVKPLQ